MTPSVGWNVLYLAVMGAAGLALAGRRISGLLLK